MFQHCALSSYALTCALLTHDRSLPSAIELLHHRGQVQPELSGGGSHLAVGERRGRRRRRRGGTQRRGQRRGRRRRRRSGAGQVRRGRLVKKKAYIAFVRIIKTEYGDICLRVIAFLGLSVPKQKEPAKLVRGFPT